MPLPPLVSYKQILYPTPTVAQLVDDLVTNVLPFPANGKNGLVIYGPPGTGKTSLMRLLPDPMEQHRSGQLAYLPSFFAITQSTSVPSLLRTIENTATHVPLYGRYQFFLLDEADNLAKAGLNSLRSVMSVPDSIFILTTNDVSIFPPAVISRSHLIDMTPPPPAAALGLVQQALANSGVTQPLSDDLLVQMVAACNGDLRELGSEVDKIIHEIKSTS